MCKRINFALVFLCIFHVSYSANILFVFTGGTYSHDISIWPLVIRLADRNHSVTFYSAHNKKPWNDSRIKVIVPSKIKEVNSRYLGDTLALRLQKREADLWKILPNWSYEICKYIVSDLESEDGREIFGRVKFDLVIVDSALCDCGFIMAYYHRAKVIVSDSTSVLPWYHQIYGFPAESDWLPATSTFFHYPMSIFNVIENYFEPLYWTYIRRTQFYPKLEDLMKQLLKTPNIPSFLELERKAALIFVNTHPSVDLPRSLPPNVVQIGGMQMWGQQNATIPADLNQFIEEADLGVILLAFGSSIDFSQIPKSIEDAFFGAFIRFPHIHFIVKASASSRPTNCPKNLRYEKWIPQKEVLGHRKTLACITHGGLNGIIEATYLGIPLITIPIFGEQDHQSYKLQARETGIRLEIRDLSVEELSTAITKITTDPKYRENMQKMQAAFRDRPENPLDLATYWTEYVLRYDDLSFMHPIHQQWILIYLEQCIFSTYAVTVAVLLVVFTILFSLKMFKTL